MKPINYLRLATAILFSMGIGGFAIAHEGAHQRHDVTGDVLVAQSQVVEETSDVLGNADQTSLDVQGKADQASQDIQGNADQASQEDSQVIARAQFTTKVVSREPVDQLDSIDASVSPVYFFTELTNLSGQTVTHRWLYNGTTMAEVKILVKADRWRAHSTKNMMPNWTGSWAVAVIDEEGNEITRKTFDYATPVRTANVVETEKEMME